MSRHRQRWRWVLFAAPALILAFPADGWPGVLTGLMAGVLLVAGLIDARRQRSAPGWGPPAPQGVCAVYDDGREVPLEVVYRGRLTDGTHHWQAVLVLGGPPSTVQIEVMPANTTVSVGWGP